MKLYDNDAYRDQFMEFVYDLLRSDGTNDRANLIIDKFDSAPEVEAEPLLPNNPLTIEDLREMDGIPVFVTKNEESIGYALVYSPCSIVYITSSTGSKWYAEDLIDEGCKFYH